MTDPSTGLYFVYDTSGNALYFTPPAGCTNVCFRFGVGGITTAVYHNIRLHKVDHSYLITNYQSRKLITYGSPIGELYTPIRDGHRFIGWYTGENQGGNQVMPTDVFTKGVTVYSSI